MSQFDDQHSSSSISNRERLTSVATAHRRSLAEAFNRQLCGLSDPFTVQHVKPAGPGSEHAIEAVCHHAAVL